MKKRVLAALLAFAVSTSLLACGKKAEEPVKEEAETPVVEEAKAEPEPVVEEKEAEVVEDEPVEIDEESLLLSKAYADMIETIGACNYGEKFSFAYIDDDNIPELIIFSDEQNGGEKTLKIAVYLNGMNISDSIQYDSDEGAIDFWYYEKLNKIVWDQCSTAERIIIREIKDGIINDKASLIKDIYVEAYYCNDEEISAEEYEKEYDLIWNNDQEKIYFSKLEKLDKPESIDFLSRECEKLGVSLKAEAEKYNDVEPWKLAYRNLLYDFMSGKKISEYEDGYNDESRFMIKDINDDNNLELLINPFSNRWYVYDNKTASLNDYIVGAACGYDPDSEMFICDLGEGERSQILNIQSYDGKRTILWSDDWDDGDFSYREDGINSLEDFLAGTRDYSIWEYQKDDYENSKNRVPSQEEAKDLIEKYVMKEYPISGDVKEINTKNIEAIMDDSVNDNSRDKTDGSLYTVEVTAPDGYVNFRTGAGTDYEIISPISNGETLSVISDEGKWLQVEYKGKTGWVASSQVTKK